MRLSLLLRTAVITCFTLLCAGFIVSFYFRLSTTEKTEEFDLYTLVPLSAQAVMDTDDLVKLMQELNELPCSKDGNFLVFSRLFSYLKDHINTVLDNTPHGLSKQMSKMLISFHEPDNTKNQVFYFRLGNGDTEFVNQFIHKYCSSDFPVKSFSYKDEEIKIYPMLDDTFLSCYFGREFLAVSSEKKLIEEVVDARLEKLSVLTDTFFSEVHTLSGTTALPATVYLKEDSIFGSWMEFSMKVNAQAIYFTGTRASVGDTLAIVDELCLQKPVDTFPDDQLPASTFYFTKRSAADLQEVFEFATPETSLVTCLFHSEDSLRPLPNVVAAIPVKDVIRAGRSLRNMKVIAPEKLDTVFAEITGVSHLEPPYTGFYDGKLLLASDSVGFATYVHALKKGEVLFEANPVYQKAMASLSNSYHYTVIGDMKSVLEQSAGYMRFVPDFFTRHRDFFAHFVISAQITSDEGVIYPSLVFLYKDEE